MMSPCVTLRGDDQFKELKAKLQHVPEGPRPREPRGGLQVHRENRMCLTVGVLYEVESPSLGERFRAIAQKVGQAQPPTTRDLLQAFYPNL